MMCAIDKVKPLIIINSKNTEETLCLMVLWLFLCPDLKLKTNPNLTSGYKEVAPLGAPTLIIV